LLGLNTGEHYKQQEAAKRHGVNTGGKRQQEVV